MTTQPTALDTYLQRLPMILDRIKALRQLANDHLPQSNCHPLGHLGDGDLARVSSMRRHRHDKFAGSEFRQPAGWP